MNPNLNGSKVKRNWEITFPYLNEAIAPIYDPVFCTKNHPVHSVQCACMHALLSDLLMPYINLRALHPLYRVDLRKLYNMYNRTMSIILSR